MTSIAGEQWTSAVQVPGGPGRCVLPNDCGASCDLCPISGRSGAGACVDDPRFSRLELRWPSGDVGYGVPEFRLREEPAAPAPEPADYRPRYSGEIHYHCDEEGGIGQSYCCGKRLPRLLVAAIERGEHDCPLCGWRKGRCDQRGRHSGRTCNGLLAANYNTQFGTWGTKCQRCGRER